MKTFIKEHWGLITILFVVFGLVILVCSTQERKQMGGVVLEHNVTADKYGSRTYSTIIKTDDGYIEEKTGLSLYATPVGNRVYIEVVRLKHKK